MIIISDKNIIQVFQKMCVENVQAATGYMHWIPLKVGVGPEEVHKICPCMVNPLEIRALVSVPFADKSLSHTQNLSAHCDRSLQAAHMSKNISMHEILSQKLQA